MFFRKVFILKKVLNQAHQSKRKLKTHISKNAKKKEVFWIFRIMLNDYYIIVHLNTFTHPLRELLQKKVDFEPVTKVLKN